MSKSKQTIFFEEEPKADIKSLRRILKPEYVEIKEQAQKLFDQMQSQWTINQIKLIAYELYELTQG